MSRLSPRLPAAALATARRLSSVCRTAIDRRAKRERLTRLLLRGHRCSRLLAISAALSLSLTASFPSASVCLVRATCGERAPLSAALARRSEREREADVVMSTYESEPATDPVIHHCPHSQSTKYSRSSLLCFSFPSLLLHSFPLLMRSSCCRRSSRILLPTCSVCSSRSPAPYHPGSRCKCNYDLRTKLRPRKRGQKSAYFSAQILPSHELPSSS